LLVESSFGESQFGWVCRIQWYCYAIDVAFHHSIASNIHHHIVVVIFTVAHNDERAVSLCDAWEAQQLGLDLIQYLE
jgi:hypothetical protein